MRRMILVALALGTVCTALFLGCGASTGGALIHIPMSVGGSGNSTFTTPLGWTVTLRTARIALGPYYFNVSKQPSTTTAQSGLVIVQATEQSVVDPLDPALVPLAGGADGQSGEAFTAYIGLLPPDERQSPGDQALLGNSVAYVEGTAVKGATTVPFTGFVTIDISQATPQLPPSVLQRVSGATVDLTFASSQQRLQLTVDATHWFDRTDFSLLLSGQPSDAGVYTWTDKDPFHGSLLNGIESVEGVYLFTLEGS
ncbi:MAG TPA: hypothetical protein VMH40_05605 [Myxococcaceae bacterium]|nr:hypothetical protein [Myxococcaceae bacterium]